MRKWACRATNTVLAAVVAICIVELVVWSVMAKTGELYPANEVFALHSGYRMDGRVFSATAGKCLVLRLTADNCPHSQKDQHHYTSLAQEAERGGCQVIEMPPDVGTLERGIHKSAIQLQYVDMRLGRTVNPFVTPQTIVIGADGRATWHHQGAMDDDAVRRALRALHDIR